MTRYICQRCKATDFTTNPPHLCKDLRKRLARQQHAVDIVALVLSGWHTDDGACIPDTHLEPLALAVIKALSGRDLGVE